jgi:hypothetical protein
MSTNSKKYGNYLHLLCILIFASIAATGTLPYGFKFAKVYLADDYMLKLLSGISFAAAATSANVILGTYSLLKVEFKQSWTLPYLCILVLSALGSLPLGFICYFGYERILPIGLNLLTSTIVVIVNSAVGITAMTNLLQAGKRALKQFRQVAQPKANSENEAAGHVVGIFIGLIVSSVGFLAAAKGMNSLLAMNGYQNAIQNGVGYYLAIFSWIPFAALYINSSHTITADIYKIVLNIPKLIRTTTLSNLLLIVYCLFSGTAFAEITHEFFDPTKNIPAVCQNFYIQHFALWILVPIALITSAGLNYFSIRKLYSMRNKLL